MTTQSCRFTNLSDGELLEEVKRLTAVERHATAHLVASLAEFDARRLYLGEGCSCLFTYCVQIPVCAGAVDPVGDLFRNEFRMAYCPLRLGLMETARAQGGL